jgi:large subunit ribosomal protein L29
MVKMREIANMTRAEIENRLKETEEELSNLNFQLATHQLDNTDRVRLVRRDVARIKTVLREFDLGLRQPLEQDGGVAE